MSASRTLLVELQLEELPPKALKRLGEAFAQGLTEGLRAQGLLTEHSVATGFATPRRLAMQISAVLPGAADRMSSVKLMPVSVGLGSDGQATAALLKKLAAQGADAAVLPSLERRMDGKSETLFLQRSVSGVRLAAGLQIALDQTLANLPVPKLMTYQLADGWTNVQFVRPAHFLVALFGTEVVTVEALGLKAGRETRGHRFEAPIEEIQLQHADHYAEQLLEQGAVIASFAKRHGEIARQLEHVAAQQGLRPIEDAALLDEVTALVERPRVLLGQFDEAFLEVPQECLVLTMKANQKYFPLLDAKGQLTNRFLIVSNIQPKDTRAVVRGNERVVRPRLADARFFFDQDRKKSLESRLPGLHKVVYHGKLGSLGQRVQRVGAIADAIGRRLGGEALAEPAMQAARLAKTDLLTDMVGEFPELQGTMGRYYALHDGLSEDIAYAIEDHYRPRFAGDVLPRNQVGVVLALADKMETLVGLFGIGQAPTGDRDPFALRRHALGVLRMLMELELAIDLSELLQIANDACIESLGPDWPSRPPGGVAAEDDFLQDCRAFMLERLSGNLREQGYSAQEVDAVLALEPARLANLPKMLLAVRAFMALPEAAALAAANKRIGNILKKAEQGVQAQVAAELLREPAELALSQTLARIGPVAEAHFERADYAASLQCLAALKAPVDAFFDSVMVNADDPALRANRLGLLATLHAAMNRVADLSRLAVQT